MLNNNGKPGQLTAKSREDLIHIIEQQKAENKALFTDYEKAYRASLLYWVMQDLMALRVINDPIYYLDQVTVLARRYAGWGEMGDVVPFDMK